MDTELSREAYVKAQDFLARLNKCRHMLTTQEIMALRRQALHGDLEGAIEALNRMIARFYETNNTKLFVRKG